MTMFDYTVFIGLALLLFIAGGATIHMGVFGAMKPESSFVKKALTGVVSYALSGVFWYGCYGYHYLGW